MVFDRDALMDQLGGDEQLAREVIDLFVRECPLQLATIRAAIDQGSAREVYVTAHTLKGAAGTLAAREVARAALAVELLGREDRLDACETAWRDLDAAAARLLDTLGTVTFPSPT